MTNRSSIASPLSLISVVLSHLGRLQFFMNFSSMGVLHGVQFFRNRLLQCGSPMGSQVLPEILLQCRLFSMGHSSCQEPTPVWALHGMQLPSGHFRQLWQGVFHGLQVNGFGTEVFTTVMGGLKGDSAKPPRRAALRQRTASGDRCWIGKTTAKLRKEGRKKEEKKGGTEREGYRSHAPAPEQEGGSS
ncbi:hypothetical protein QYF61_000013 [Mycteria americana]|uniref:Uncharacterized protein n=1 Tax=Mycteria americana TaxID=33587 RepID=A0AAN7S220_MYCAM|nr:hypothetical protein QYF61_000013 [Mycteria americana]